MCSGRVDLEFVIRAFLKGMDGVFIGGCRLNECNYITHGNYDAWSNTYLCKKIMESIGLNPERLRIEFMSGAEGGLLAGFRRTLDTLRKAPAKGSWTDPESGESFEEQFLLPQVQRMLFGLTASAGRRSGVVSWPADLIAIANGDWIDAKMVEGITAAGGAAYLADDRFAEYLG